MNECFYIVEIGSTNTKAYAYNTLLKTYRFENIEFKKNYLKYGYILESDIEKLANYIKEVVPNTAYAHIYATSIFRELTQKQLSFFIKTLRSKVSYKSFEVVTSEEENFLTSYGAINKFDTTENICVFIGGGGSTEICIYNGKNIVETINSSIGVVDVMSQFPDLANDITNINIDTVENYIKNKLSFPKEHAKYLVLAGGDFLLRYQNAQYPVKKNTLFESINHPYIIDYACNRKYDEKYYYEISLSSLKATTPQTPKWWDGTRAMCAFTDIVAKHVGAKFILPTNISMIYGIISKLKYNQSI